MANKKMNKTNFYSYERFNLFYVFYDYNCLILKEKRKLRCKYQYCYSLFCLLTHFLHLITVTTCYLHAKLLHKKKTSFCCDPL